MSRRTDKVNELLRREIGTTIQRDFEFPGTIVTVIEVEVTDDLKEGKVWVGVVGKMAPSQVLEKLNSRHGLIQSAVARRVVLRNTPRLTSRLNALRVRHGSPAVPRWMRRDSGGPEHAESRFRKKSVTGGKAAGPEGPCSRKESSSGNGKRNR